MALTIAISNGMGGDGEMPSMLTEEKKVMPNDNSWKEECIKCIKDAEECIKQNSQEDMKMAIEHLDMAIDIIGGEPADDKEDAKDAEDMTKVEDKKKMPYDD